MNYQETSNTTDSILKMMKKANILQSFAVTKVSVKHRHSWRRYKRT